MSDLGFDAQGHSRSNLVELVNNIIMTLIMTNNVTHDKYNDQAWGDYMSNVIDYDYDYLLAV